MPDQLAQKLREIDPKLLSCKADFFTAFDPPRALMPMSALLPAEPAGEPKSAPAPSPTDSFGAKEDFAGQAAGAPKPPSAPTVDQPKPTPIPAPVPDENPASQQHSDQTAENNIWSPQEQHDSGSPNSDNNQDSVLGSGKDPGEDIDPTQNKNTEGNSANLNPVDAADQTKEEPTQNGPSVNLIGTPTSLDPSDDPILADGAPTPADPLTTINNQVIQPLSHGVSVADTTLTPGAPAITVSGTFISLGSSAFIVGASTVPIHFQPSDPFVTTIAGQPITAAPGAVEAAGTTLHPGIPGVTLDGTAVSLDTANHLVIGSKTIALSDENRNPGKLILGGTSDQSSPNVAEPFITTIAGHAITAAPNAVNVAGTTLHPGDPGMTVDGTKVSLDSTNHLVIGSKTIPLTSESAGLGSLIFGGLNYPSTSDDDAAPPFVTTVAGQVITAASNAVMVAGATLYPGDPGMRIDGTIISLDTADHLIVGSKTITLPTSGNYDPNSANNDNAHPFITTVANQAITAAPTAVTFAGTTLLPGAPAKKINGTLVSLNRFGQLIVGEKTISLPSPSASGGVGTNFFYSSSLWNGSSNVTNTGDGINVFEGKAAVRVNRDLSYCLLLVFLLSSLSISGFLARF